MSIRSSFIKLFGFIAFFLAISTASAETIVISSPPIPPVSGSDPEPGYLKNILVEAGKRIGVTIQFKNQPAQRSLISSNAGRTDGELHRIAGLEKAYPNLIRIPEPVLIDQFVGFTNRPDVTIPDWQKTGNLKVFYPRGWNIYAKAFGRDAEHQPGLHGASLFQMVQSGRVDIAMHTLDKGTYIAHKQNIKVFPVKPAFSIQPMYVYLHKSKKHLVLKLAKAFADVKADGTYARIKKEVLHSHGLTDKAYFQSPFDNPAS